MNLTLFEAMNHSNYIKQCSIQQQDQYLPRSNLNSAQIIVERAAFSHRKWKQTAQEHRFKQKMQAINRKKGRYKRSTNNCHKKYIGILKNLLFMKLSNQTKDYILVEYDQYKNSRVYFFIMLAYIKWYLNVFQIRWVFQHFCQQVQQKISRYRLQIKTTSNSNFIHFRQDQIIQMQYSIHSINYYLREEAMESVKILYQKNKFIIIKKNQYLRTLQILEDAQKQLAIKFVNIDIKIKLESLRLNEIVEWNQIMVLVTKNKNNNMIDQHKSTHRQRGRPPKYPKYIVEEEHSQHKEKEQSEINKMEHQEMQQRHIVNCQSIKRQEGENDVNKYPLLGLQNSYRLITEINWHSWLIQKQKRLQFLVKCSQQKETRTAQEQI